jgi:predicted PurR-regulated permease PerM
VTEPFHAEPFREVIRERPALVPTGLDRAAAYAWRLIVIGIVALAALWLIREARVVFFPIVVAVFVTRALSPISGWLRRHRWRPALAALVSMLGFFLALGGVLAVAGTSFADEADSVRPTLVQAVDDIEDWLVDDSPFNVSRSDVDSVRQRVSTEFDRFLSSSDGTIADRATLVAEVFTGFLLAIILTFFMLRDGRRLSEWVASRGAGDRPDRIRRSLDAAWSALAGYLRGASILGIVEATIIGLTLWIVGGSLIVPVMVLTVLGAFVPIVGAVLAGVVAVLVALVTAGTGPAIVVALVVVVVQQLDNDLLAPVIYGRALSLHPVAILISVVAGGALLGLTGTILAVPVVAVVFNAVREYRKSPADQTAQITDIAATDGEVTDGEVTVVAD